MYHVTLDYAKKHLDELLERAESESEGIVIVKENQSFILINKDELDSIRETSQWLKDPEIINDIKEARQEYKQDNVLTMEQIFSNND
jgi:prevent-host-death family protein